MHTPVLFEEAIKALNVIKEEKYIDATAGEGGHLRAIAKKAGRVLAIDSDPAQIKKLKEKLKDEKNISFIRGNFADIARIATETDFATVAGIIIDLGLSMGQLKFSKKGFSFKSMEDDLDMRYIEKATLSAADILNSYTAKELEEVFSKYGEEPSSANIASQIEAARRIKKIKTVGDLLFCIDAAVGSNRQDVARRIFQALRIVVNNELENLRMGLSGSLQVLKEGGRLVVISFHSLEDRIVKDFVKKAGLATLTKKPIVNRQGAPFEKNAKMRVIINKKIN